MRHSLYAYGKRVPPAFAAVCLALLTGCQSFSARSSFARMRVIDLSPDTASIDVYQGNTAVAYNLSYGTVTSYVPLVPGASTITVDLAGSKQVLSTAKAVLNPGAQYTLLVNNPAASLQQALLVDHVPLSAANVPLVRLIHQAGHAGAVDVYLVPAGQSLTSVLPVVTNLAAGASTGYLPVPAGVCTAVMLPSGTIPTTSTIPAHTGVQIDYGSGSARSLILLDGQTSLSSGLQVIATVDAEPLG